MSAEIIELAESIPPKPQQPALAELAQQIKIAIQQGNWHTAEADMYWIEAGRLLKIAKEMKPTAITWPEFVREHFDLSRERADELIRIADGKVTLEQTRERKRKANKRLRELHRTMDPVPRGAGSEEEQGSDCNPLEGGEQSAPLTPDQMRAAVKQALFEQANAALSWLPCEGRIAELKETGLDSDPEVLAAIGKVAAAWSGVLTKLKG